MTQFRTSVALMVPLCVVLLAAGCLLHRPDSDVAPARPARASFNELPATQPATFTGRSPWWESFNDPSLNRLVELALRDNLDLRQLSARIEQAAARHRQSRAQLFPSLFGSGDYESVWRDLDDADAIARSESASAGALLNWELDVWGRIRSASRAQQAGLEASRFDLHGGKLLLSAMVVETCFQLLEQREQLRVLHNQIEVNETLLDLTRLRFGQGQSSIVDVLQQREQLESTRALLPDLEARAGELSYTLDVLLGRAPGEARETSRVLPDPPDEFREVGVPADLLINRPDLMAAQWRVTSLDYRVGEALADRLPRFEIGGTLSAIGDPSFSTLLGSVFGSVVGPVVDGGQRRAEVALRRAQLDEAVAAFSNSYLGAVRDVEIALLRERKQAERVVLLEKQLATARNLLTESRNRYSQGLTDYLPVLAAVSTVQNLERETITSRRELLSERVALHRALGGPLPASATLSARTFHEE